MLLNTEVYSRDPFLRVVDMQTSAWTQRQYKNEVALGLGLWRPVHVNEYSALDMLTVAQTGFLNNHASISLAEAAALCRLHWQAWTAGIAEVERSKDVDEPFHLLGATGDPVCFVVGAGVSDKQKVVGVVGKMKWAIKKVDDPDMALTVLPLHIVIRAVKSRAGRVGVVLPKWFVPAAPNTPEFADWMGLVEEYRRFALTRRAKKAKEPA
jgi:hypothetical protein